MEIMVLAVTDCPNLAVLDARLGSLLAGRGDVTVVHRVIDDLEQARALGMTGSPTLLVDGVDPFAVPGQPASVSCRLYLVDGRLAGSPSIEQLREVL